MTNATTATTGEAGGAAEAREGGRAGSEDERRGPAGGGTVEEGVYTFPG